MFLPSDNSFRQLLCGCFIYLYLLLYPHMKSLLCLSSIQTCPPMACRPCRLGPIHMAHHHIQQPSAKHPAVPGFLSNPPPTRHPCRTRPWTRPSTGHLVRPNGPVRRPIRSLRPRRPSAASRCRTCPASAGGAKPRGVGVHGATERVGVFFFGSPGAWGVGLGRTRTRSGPSDGTTVLVW